MNSEKRDSLDIVKENYTEFSRYTVVHRTYPSVYDGLKEVERRCLYASYKDAPASMTKLSTITGLIMAYHPHAEASGTVITLAGEYQSPFPLYDTQGNFGDAENPASAPRYLECKLSDRAKKLYFSLIDQAPMDNFEVKEEPLYLPTLFPVALLQGCFGVGQGTPNVLIPSLNYDDLKKFIINYIKTGEKEVTLDNFVRLTDYNQIRDDSFRNSSICDLLNTGKGTITYEPKIEYHNNKIVIRNLYVLAKFSSLLEKLKPDIQADKIDVRDESDIERVWVIEKVKNKVFDMDACVKMIKQRFTFKENYCMYFHDGIQSVRAYSLGEVIEKCYEKYHEAYVKKINSEIDDLCSQQMVLECLGMMSEHTNIVVDNKLTNEEKVSKLKEAINNEYNEYTITKCLQKPISMLKRDDKAIEDVKIKIKNNQNDLKNLDKVIVKQIETL